MPQIRIKICHLGLSTENGTRFKNMGLGAFLRREYCNYGLISKKLGIEDELIKIIKYKNFTSSNFI